MRRERLVQLSLEQLQNKAGKVATNVWLKMGRCRDADCFGHTAIKAVTIAGGLGLSGKKRVRRAFARLLKLGLLEKIGRKDSLRYDGKRLYHHKVVGSWALGSVWLPPVTANRVKNARGHGGARTGSGRKVRPGSRRQLVAERRVKLGLPARAASRPNSSGVHRAVFKRGTQGQVLSSVSVITSGFPKGESSGRAHTRDALRAAKLPAAPGPDGVLKQINSDPNKPKFANPLEEAMAIFTGAYRPPVPPRRMVSLSALNNAGLFPDMPIESKLPSPHLPEPPRLKEGAPISETIPLLVRTYRAVVWKRLRQQPWRWMDEMRRAERGDLKLQPAGKGDAEDKTYRRFVLELRAAAEVLAQMGFPVAAWASWRMDRWQAIMEKRGVRKIRPPDILWLFKSDDIVSQRGWFEKNLSAYMGGKPRLGPKHRDLLYRYHRLRIEVGGGGNDSPEHVRAVVAKHFPEGYSRAFAQAKAESARIQADLDARAARGEHLWA